MCSLSQFLLLLSSTNGSFSLQAFPTAGNTVGHFPWLHAETRGNGNARRINKWSADKERWTRKSKDRERKKERQREEERIIARKREERIERDRMSEENWALPAWRRRSQDFMAAQGVARARAEHEDIPQMHFVNKARPVNHNKLLWVGRKKNRRKKLRGKSKRK